MKNKILLNFRLGIILFLILGGMLATLFNWNLQATLVYLIGGAISGAVLYRFLIK